MKKQLTFPQFRKFCLFFKSFPVKGTCTHKGNQGKALHYERMKSCNKWNCPFRNQLNMNEFDAVTPKS